MPVRVRIDDRQLCNGRKGSGRNSIGSSSFAIESPR